MVAPNFKRRALEVARTHGIARTRDFDDAGVPRVYLQRLRDQGLLIQPGRGLYQLVDVEFSAAHSLAQAARAVPHGTICLLSALQFHELSTQTPHEIWMLLASKAWAPTNPAVTIRIVRGSGEALTAGIEYQLVDGVGVPLTVPAKTVADCFKHRNKIGHNVAIDALKDCLRAKRATVDEVWKYAGICRVQNVMRPYLEALL